MKKTSIIKIICVVLIIGLIHFCHAQRYTSLKPHIMIVKEDGSFLDSSIDSLKQGHSLIVEGERGSYYHGYFFIEGKKYSGYISKDKVINYTSDHSFENYVFFMPYTLIGLFPS